MAGHLLKNCAAVIVDEGNGPTVRRNVDLLTDGPAIRVNWAASTLNDRPRRTSVRSLPLV